MQETALFKRIEKKFYAKQSKFRSGHVPRNSLVSLRLISPRSFLRRICKVNYCSRSDSDSSDLSPLVSLDPLCILPLYPVNCGRQMGLSHFESFLLPPAFLLGSANEESCLEMKHDGKNESQGISHSLTLLVCIGLATAFN